MISILFPLIFEAAYCSTLNCTEKTSLRSLFSFKLMLPLSDGAVPETSFPTSHFNLFSNESKLYDPSDALRLTFVTQAGILQVTTTFITGFGLTKRLLNRCTLEISEFYLRWYRNINFPSLQWSIRSYVERERSSSIYWRLKFTLSFLWRFIENLVSEKLELTIWRDEREHLFHVPAL